MKTKTYTFTYYEQGYPDPKEEKIKASWVWEANDIFKFRHGPSIRVTKIRVLR